MGIPVDQLPEHMRSKIKNDPQATAESSGAPSSAPTCPPSDVKAVANLSHIGDRQRMNKLEARFADYLEWLIEQGEVVHYEYENHKVRLAANKTWYTPDFWVIRHDGRIEIYETKGFWRDDARIKTKVAAALYPWYTWYGAQEDNNGNWIFEKF